MIDIPFLKLNFILIFDFVKFYGDAEKARVPLVRWAMAMSGCAASRNSPVLCFLTPSQKTGAWPGTRATPNQLIYASGPRRYSAGSNRPLALGTSWLKPIKCGSNITVACRSLQPDSHHQPAYDSGGDGMSTVIMCVAKDLICQF